MGALTLARSPVLLGYDPRQLLLDNFEGGNINPALWTITDTESKLSIVGGLLNVAGGMASPAFNDPSIVSRVAFPREAGLTFEVQVTPTAANKDFEVGFCDGSLVTIGEELHAFNLTSTGVIIAVRDPGANPTTPLGYAAGASLWLRLVLLATGAYFYVSKDERITWELIWIEPTIATSPVYPFLNSYNAAFTAKLAEVYRAAVKAAIINATPAGGDITAGGTLVTNGTMEADANWASVVGNEPTSNTRSSTQAQAGTYSREVVASGASQLIQSDVFTSAVTVGQFYKVSVYIYPPGTQCNISLLTGAGASLPGSGTFGGMTAGQWNNKVLTYCEPTGGANARIRLGSVAAGTWYFDTVTIEPLTFSSLLTDGYDAQSKVGAFDFDVTEVDNLQAGGVICLDSDSSPANFLMPFLNTLTYKAELWKCESGTFTNLISGNVTPAAGQTLRVMSVRGTSGLSNAQVALYYNTVKVGTTQTIDLSTGYGTLVHGLRTVSATVAVKVNT